MLRRSGEAAVQRLRDEARLIAGELHLGNEFKRLDTLIGTLLGSRQTPLESPPHRSAPPRSQLGDW
jgi:hypothetical protein